MQKAKTKNMEVEVLRTSMFSNTRSVATQTGNLGHLLEIAKLQEQVKLLQLENNVLRKHMKTDNQKLENVPHEDSCTTQLASKTNVEISSCGCKGNCRSSRCGCVKKNNKCNSSCRCDNKMCQNQNLKRNRENKENVDRNDAGTYKQQSVRKNKAAETLVNNMDLLNLDIENKPNDNEKKHIQEKLNNIHPSFANKESVKLQNLQTESDCINTVIVRKKGKQKKQNNNEKSHLIKVDENAKTEVTANMISCNSTASKDSVTEMFDPMKPRHQLSRTPPNNKKCADDKILNINDMTQSSIISQSLIINESFEEKAIKSSNIQDVKEEKVDWEQHNSQLIPCKKCHRTFLPHRIKKHEACCKKI